MGPANYQFPGYKFILFPPFVLRAFMLFYADAHGQTAIECGKEAIDGALWRRTAAGILAFVAFCNVINLFYGMGVHAVYAGPWPKPFPSWVANEQCGGTTGVACPCAK